MKLTGLDVFDSTIQNTNVWLKEFMQEMNWTDRKRAFAAFRCVLHAVRDSLTVEHAVYFGEQLPMLMRGSYFEHWNTSNKPKTFRSKEDFFAGLSGEVGKSGMAEPEIMVRAVFRVLERKAAEGEIQDVRNILPRELQDFWPPALRAA
jgi:uncharacterized protein (DUF2267 family)